MNATNETNDEPLKRSAKSDAMYKLVYGQIPTTQGELSSLIETRIASLNPRKADAGKDGKR